MTVERLLIDPGVLQQLIFAYQAKRVRRLELTGLPVFQEGSAEGARSGAWQLP